MAVEDSKLQRLTTSFEEIKMEEDESFSLWHVKWYQSGHTLIKI